MIKCQHCQGYGCPMCTEPEPVKKPKPHRRKKKHKRLPDVRPSESRMIDEAKHYGADE